MHLETNHGTNPQKHKKIIDREQIQKYHPTTFETIGICTKKIQVNRIRS